MCAYRRGASNPSGCRVSGASHLGAADDDALAYLRVPITASTVHARYGQVRGGLVIIVCSALLASTISIGLSDA